MDVPLLQLEKGQGNQGALAEASRRQQEHFLAICQVSDQLVQFGGPIDEVDLVNDFPKNERILVNCHITLNSVTLNSVIGKHPPNGCLYALWRNAKRRN